MCEFDWREIEASVYVGLEGYGIRRAVMREFERWSAKRGGGVARRCCPGKGGGHISFRNGAKRIRLLVFAGSAAPPDMRVTHKSLHGVFFFRADCHIARQYLLPGARCAA